MAFTCPSCNAPSPSEARFCRLCGTPLKTAASASGPISPLAQTVPLTAEPRTTDGLPMDDPRRHADTRRVGSAEIDAILQRQRLESGPVAPPDGDGGSSGYLGEQYAAPTTSSLVLPAPAKTNLPKKKRWWPVVLLSVVLVGLAAGLLIYYLRHRESNAGGPAIVTMDQSQAVAQHLDEAQALLASGKINEAIQRLRSVVNLDPSNVEAHRLLAGALMRNGSRREAIDEYFIVAQKDPQDLPTLHALASLQFREQLYADAVDSYRRLQSAMGEARLAPQDQLDYADALRIAGFTEDARTEYQKLIANGPPDIAATARKNLAQLPLQTASSVPANARPSPNAGNASTGSPTLPVTAVTQKPGTTTVPPGEVKVDPDADYSLGVRIVGSRDPKNIPRPELLHALEVLQRAARNGQHRSQARDLAERLGREFDRRRSLGVQ
ncbi:MAG: tetratricopeptide repeat protein [Pyrinomonadaceae bacterium]